MSAAIEKEVEKLPIPSTAGTGAPTNIAKPVNSKTPVSSNEKNVSSNLFPELGAVIENRNGFDILKFKLQPGASLLTNQETLSYMDGGLSTSASLGDGGFFGGLARLFTGSSMLQNLVVNSTQNTLKMALSPHVQGSIIRIDINPGETWKFEKKSFLACTNNLTTTGDLNMFNNFTVGFITGEWAYTVIQADKGTTGSVWISGYGAVEKHVVEMGTNSNVPFFINNGCFLGMISSDSSRDYWARYITVGTPSNDLFNSMFTQIGFVLKVQDTIPSSGPTKVTVLTQSLNPKNLEKYIANIAQKIVTVNRDNRQPTFLSSTPAVVGAAGLGAAGVGATGVGATQPGVKVSTPGQTGISGESVNPPVQTGLFGETINPVAPVKDTSTPVTSNTSLFGSSNTVQPSANTSTKENQAPINMSAGSRKKNKKNKRYTRRR